MRLSTALYLIGAILILDQIIFPVFLGIGFHNDGTGFSLVEDRTFSLIPSILGIGLIIWAIYERRK